MTNKPKEEEQGREEEQGKEEERKTEERKAARAASITELKKELEAAQCKAAENLGGWQRAQADFINYKKRCEQEKIDAIQFANARFVSGVLPVLDDIRRAYQAIPPEVEETPWVQGIRLIEKKITSYLETQGVIEIKALGEKFDPNCHEAVAQGPGEDGIITEEIYRGYALNGRVLRASKVIVGNGQTEEKEE